MKDKIESFIFTLNSMGFTVVLVDESYYLIGSGNRFDLPLNEEDTLRIEGHKINNLIDESKSIYISPEMATGSEIPQHITNQLYLKISKIPKTKVEYSKNHKFIVYHT